MRSSKTLLLQALLVTAYLFSGRPVSAEPGPPLAPVVARKALPFDAPNVRLLDGPFRENQLRNLDYLLSIDNDRLLHMFRVTAGLPSSAAPLGGWEGPACWVRGHSLGHYLTACALMVAATGDPRLKVKADAIVAELAKCQEASPKQGFHPGYLAAIPESHFDNLDAGRAVWAPWYVYHKLMAGLLDVHLHCGNRQALDILKKSAEWVEFRVDRLPADHMQRNLQTEFGGMNEVLADLYAVTGDAEHLRLSRAFDHRAVFDPLAAGKDCLDGLHANTQIPKIIGAAREYEMTGEKRYRDVAEFFWRNVALSRSFVLGGNSDREHFFPIAEFPKHLGPMTMETCNTYNMLKLTRQVFAWEPSAQKMDFYERALFNHILGSQDPVKGTGIYFASVRPGFFKLYATPFDSFWCCTGTGMENHARYGEAIYFHDDRTLWVTLFIASRLSWADQGMTITQETKFPEQDSTRLTVSCRQPVDLSIKLRWPAWARDGMAVTVNGRAQEAVGQPGCFVTLERTWCDGDQIEARMPMSLHTEALPGDPRTVALLYGPLVLAGEMGADSLTTDRCYVMSNASLLWLRCPEAPVLVGDAAGLLPHIRPVAGKPLTFRSHGIGRPDDVLLSPYYRMHHQRFTVYWTLRTEEEWQALASARRTAAAARKELEPRIVDEILFGDPGNEHAHKLQGKWVSEVFQNRVWCESHRGAEFGFELKVEPDRPMSLRCTWWGDEKEETVQLFTGRTSPTGPRQFDIVVDNEKMATQGLKSNKPGNFFDADYPLPEELTRGKTRVAVKFRAHPGATAGRLFECLMLRSP